MASDLEFDPKCQDKNHMSKADIDNPSNSVDSSDFDLGDDITDDSELWVQVENLLLPGSKTSKHPCKASEKNVKTVFKNNSEDSAKVTVDDFAEIVKHRPQSIKVCGKHKGKKFLGVTRDVKADHDIKADLYHINAVGAVKIVAKDLKKDKKRREFRITVHLQHYDDNPTKFNLKLKGTVYLDKHSLGQLQWIQLRAMDKDKRRSCGSLSVKIMKEKDPVPESTPSGPVPGSEQKISRGPPRIIAPTPDDEEESKDDSDDEFPPPGFLPRFKHMRLIDFPDGEIAPGTGVVSANKKAVAVFQEDGNLVVYHRSDVSEPFHYVWASWTHNAEANKLVPQTDNNLVLYSNDNPLFWTGTNGWFINYETQANGKVINKTQLTLGLQDDGNLLWYLKNDDGQVDTVVWHTGTGSLRP